KFLCPSASASSLKTSSDSVELQKSRKQTRKEKEDVRPDGGEALACHPWICPSCVLLSLSSGFEVGGNSWRTSGNTWGQRAER
ncbi:hypothetical protein PDJAM_G00058530, partial [Pangasius djambal]|nr:hypothetical protein [Pangasius djambal]